MCTNLKKVIIIILSILPLALNGQSEENKKISFGVGAGVSLNNVYNHIREAEFEPKFSAVLITVNAQKQLSNRWNLLSELDYTHKGPKGHKINYFVISMLPSYKIVAKPNISILGGPYIGYMLKYEAYGSVEKHEDLKNYDLGIDSGISFTTRVNEKLDLYISPRIEVGLIRFSFSNHISYQLKTGIRFN